LDGLKAKVSHSSRSDPLRKKVAACPGFVDF